LPPELRRPGCAFSVDNLRDILRFAAALAAFKGTLPEGRIGEKFPVLLLAETSDNSPSTFVLDLDKFEIDNIFL